MNDTSSPGGRWSSGLRSVWHRYLDRPLSSRALVLVLMGWVVLFSVGFRYLANPLPDSEIQGMTRCESVFFGEPVVWVSPELEGRQRVLARVHEGVHARQIQEQGCVRLANLLPANAVRSEAEAFCAEVLYLAEATGESPETLVRLYAYNLHDAYLHGKLLGLERVTRILRQECGLPPS